MMPNVRSTLSVDDTRDIHRYFTELLARTARSTAGVVLSQADNLSLASIKRAAARGECEAPGGAAGVTWPKVDINGHIVYSGREVTAQPKKPHGDQNAVGGYTFEHDEIISFSFVSSQLSRLHHVLVGPLDRRASDVFREYMDRGGVAADLQGVPSCDHVAHLTPAWIALAHETRAAAQDVVDRACRRHNLKGKEAAFVAAVDVKVIAPGQPNTRNRRYHAAVKAGYPKAEAEAVANELSAKTAIAEAILMREKAAVIDSLTRDAQLLDEIRRRSRLKGELSDRHRTMLAGADAQARELVAAACRAWNAVKLRGAT